MRARSIFHMVALVLTVSAQMRCMLNSAARLRSRHSWNAEWAGPWKLSVALTLLKTWNLRLMAGSSL